MKKLLMIIPLVILLCFTFGCQQGEEMTKEVGVKALSDEDVAAIKVATEKYIQAVVLGWRTSMSLSCSPDEPASESLPI